MLIGENIRLRRITFEDAELVATWYGDPDYVGGFANVWPRSRQEFEHHLERETDHETEASYLIIPRDADEPLGIAGYWDPFTAKMFQGIELSYEVHPSARRKGIATQAACLLVNHLFNALPIERVQATTVVGNETSRRVLERAGMQQEGSYRRVTFLHGTYVDMNVYSIVRADWRDEDTYRRGRQPF